MVTFDPICTKSEGVAKHRSGSCIPDRGRKEQLRPEWTCPSEEDVEATVLLERCSGRVIRNEGRALGQGASGVAF